ncbi:MAG TPA: hypothetical protein PLS93_18100, partial [Accumulibacter sp.]|nr:hypothetical protein [Accumulibacter sp.]
RGAAAGVGLWVGDRDHRVLLALAIVVSSSSCSRRVFAIFLSPCLAISFSSPDRCSGSLAAAHQERRV